MPDTCQSSSTFRRSARRCLSRTPARWCRGCARSWTGSTLRRHRVSESRRPRVLGRAGRRRQATAATPPPARDPAPVEIGQRAGPDARRRHVVVVVARAFGGRPEHGDCRGATAGKRDDIAVAVEPKRAVKPRRGPPAQRPVNRVSDQMAHGQCRWAPYGYVRFHPVWPVEARRAERPARPGAGELRGGPAAAPICASISASVSLMRSFCGPTTARFTSGTYSSVKNRRDSSVSPGGSNAVRRLSRWSRRISRPSLTGLTPRPTSASRRSAAASSTSRFA